MNKGSKELSLERAGSKNLRVRIGEDDFQPEIGSQFPRVRSGTRSSSAL